MPGVYRVCTNSASDSAKNLKLNSTQLTHLNEVVDWILADSVLSATWRMDSRYYTV